MAQQIEHRFKSIAVKKIDFYFRDLQNIQNVTKNVILCPEKSDSNL